MSHSVMYPVQALQERLSALEAAIAVCLAEPSHKPVHKLRTESRKVEALLLLLDVVPEVPEHRKQGLAVQRQLRKLRRAAGEVRDLDVHRQLLEEFAGAQQETLSHSQSNEERDSTVSSGAARAEQADTHAEVANAAVLSKAACELRDALDQAREVKAETLRSVLGKQQVKVAKRCQKLMKTLEGSKGVALPAVELLRDAEALVMREGLAEPRPLGSFGENELHNVRKATKKARYLAEMLPGNATLVKAARRLEAVQEAGGQWHDALQLARAARRRYGRGHALTGVYREKRDKTLCLYQQALERDLLAALRRPSSPGKARRKISDTTLRRQKRTAA